MIDARRLRLLRELAQRGTITAVAETLAFTPSAVSQQLARLEEEAGVPLLEKIGRRVRLTDAGQLLVAHAEIILASLDAAQADLEAHVQRIYGHLRVAAFHSVAFALFPPALAHLASDHPELRVDLLEAPPEQTLPALMSGDLDLVCADDYAGESIQDPAIQREDLLEDPLRIAVSSGDPLANERAIRLADLADRPWASGHTGSAYSAAVESTCRRLGGFMPDVRHRASDLFLLLGLVRANRAVALLPDLLHADRYPDIVVRPIRDAPVTRTIYTAVRRGSAARPSLIVLRQALAQAAADQR